MTRRRLWLYPTSLLPSWTLVLVISSQALSRNIDHESLDYVGQFSAVQNNACYSCASVAYLELWNQRLLDKYYPPRNFTDRCWQPDYEIGSVPCTSACFTIVEDVRTHGAKAGAPVWMDNIVAREKRTMTVSEGPPKRSSGQAVMRGCVDRLLLFGMDIDIKEHFISFKNSCREMNRDLLHLTPLHEDSQVVLMCTCVGEFCNKDDAEDVLSRAVPKSLSLVTLISVVALFLI